MSARRAAAGVAVAGVLVAATTAGSHAAARPPAPASAAASARLLVEASEFRFTLSRGAVRPGRVLVQLRGAGEDPHDLVVRRRGSRSGARFAEVAPGEVVERRLRLRRGRYELVCTLPRHLRRGMRAQLRVR